jgi:hypothetical protein
VSLYDFQASRHIAELDPPFAALIMAAYRKSDTGNSALLEQAFPDICRELRRRYEAPGGVLDSERPPTGYQAPGVETR